jgi:hypothetical protein
MPRIDWRAPINEATVPAMSDAPRRSGAFLFDERAAGRTMLAGLIMARPPTEAAYREFAMAPRNTRYKGSLKGRLANARFKGSAKGREARARYKKSAKGKGRQPRDTASLMPAGRLKLAPAHGSRPNFKSHSGRGRLLRAASARHGGAPREHPRERRIALDAPQLCQDRPVG